MIKLAIAIAALIALSPAAEPAHHWHPGNWHGVYGGQTLTEAECEALFGGPGWE